MFYAIFLDIVPLFADISTFPPFPSDKYRSIYREMAFRSRSGFSLRPQRSFSPYPYLLIHTEVFKSRAFSSPRPAFTPQNRKIQPISVINRENCLSEPRHRFSVQRLVPFTRSMKRFSEPLLRRKGKGSSGERKKLTSLLSL